VGSGGDLGRCAGYLLEDLVRGQVCIAGLCDRENAELADEESICLRELCVRVRRERFAFCLFY
jgi:hypothetical protein